MYNFMSSLLDSRLLSVIGNYILDLISLTFGSEEYNLFISLINFSFSFFYDYYNCDAFLSDWSSDYSDCWSLFEFSAMESDLYLSVLGGAAGAEKLNSFINPLNNEFSLIGTFGFGGSTGSYCRISISYSSFWIIS